MAPALAATPPLCGIPQSTAASMACSTTPAKAAATPAASQVRLRMQRVRSARPSLAFARRPTLMKHAVSPDSSDTASSGDAEADDAAKISLGECSKEMQQLAEDHLEEWDKCEDKAAQRRERTLQLGAYEMRRRAIEALKKMQLEGEPEDAERLRRQMRKVEQHRRRVSSKFDDYKEELEAKTKEITPMLATQDPRGLRKLLTLALLLFGFHE